MSGYEKLGVFAAALVVFVWLAPKLMSLVLGSAASIAAPRGRPTNPPGSDLPAEIGTTQTPSGFARYAVEAVGADWSDAADINTKLGYLQQSRLLAIMRDDKALRSLAAWKMAVCRQSALYRLVALSEAATIAWNSRNPVGAMTATIATIENAAVFCSYARRIAQHAAAPDFAGLEALADANGFSQAFDRTAATQDSSQVLQGLRTLPPRVQTAYERLSDLADPRFVVRHQLFGTLDKAGSSVCFSPEESFDKAVFDLVLAGMSVIQIIEPALEVFDLATAKLAERDAA